MAGEYILSGVDHFVATIALIGIVIVVASLLSGFVERIGIPLVGAFLVLGAALGPAGFGLIDVQLAAPELRVLATLGLALVLFSDAVTISLRSVREHRVLVGVVLGPGTILPAALIGMTAYWLLDIPAAAAAILGAALASTDPVLLRAVLRAPSLPATARIALRLESGTNDAVLLPVIAVATLVLQQTGPLPQQELARHLVGLFVLGPVLGALVGWIGITTLVTVRTRVGVRRDYESLYALGLGFAAYAAAEAVGGSGFLAAFAAGLAIAALDVELCDCFLEYGEATAEMLLLLTFVAFGTSLIWTGLSVLDWSTMMVAVVALFARTIVLYPVLSRIGVRGTDRKLIALFGPRGLSSLLLVLLPVFAGVRGAERLFTITALVVLLSLVVHGAIIGFYLRRTGDRLTPATSAPPAANSVPEKITIEEMRELQGQSEPTILVDARAIKSYLEDDRHAVGAVRLPPEDPVRTARARRLDQHATLVVYCA
jgi:NhaP-type Na+/H+ or K+/H+ antiporter